LRVFYGNLNCEGIAGYADISPFIAALGSCGPPKALEAPITYASPVPLMDGGR
jgi:hypothetical protein